MTRLSFVTPPTSIARPALRYFGGKWLMAPTILAALPPHTHYVEPFGGAFSVGLRKPRSGQEIYNEINPRIHNFMVQVKGSCHELIERLEGMPPPTKEYLQQFWEPHSDPIQDAAYIYYLSQHTFHGVGGRWLGGTSEERLNARPKLDHLLAVSHRLRWTQLWQENYSMVIRQVADDPQALIYCDPPYLHQTRSQDSRRGEHLPPRTQFAYELTAEDHEQLLGLITQVNCQVVISGYECDLYNNYLEGWVVTSTATTTNGGDKKKEMIWSKSNG